MAEGTRQCVPRTNLMAEGTRQCGSRRSDAARSKSDFLLKLENELSTRFVWTSQQKRARGQKSVYFYLILKTFTTHFLSKDGLASTKRKFSWTALSPFLLKNDPQKSISTCPVWVSGSKGCPWTTRLLYSNVVVHDHFLLFSSLHRVNIAHEYITTAVFSASTVAHVRDDTRCDECICI